MLRFGMVGAVCFNRGIPVIDCNELGHKPQLIASEFESRAAAARAAKQVGGGDFAFA